MQPHMCCEQARTKAEQRMQARKAAKRAFSFCVFVSSTSFYGHASPFAGLPFTVLCPPVAVDLWRSSKHHCSPSRNDVLQSIAECVDGRPVLRSGYVSLRVGQVHRLAPSTPARASSAGLYFIISTFIIVRAACGSTH